MQCQPTISNEFIELLAVCFVALQFSNFKEPMNHMYSTEYTHLKIYRRQFIIKTSAIRTKQRTDVEEMSRQFICIRFVTMPANIHTCIRWVFITFALVSHLFEVNRCESSCFSRCNQTFITHIKTRKLNTSASLVTDNKETCNTNTHTHSGFSKGNRHWHKYDLIISFESDTFKRRKYKPCIVHVALVLGLAIAYFMNEILCTLRVCGHSSINQNLKRQIFA